MKNAMSITRELYYKKRRSFFFLSNGYNKLIKPEWMYSNNDKRFDSTYTQQKVLFKKGRIALGKIVQANSTLFSPGKYDCPAAMIYTEDSYFEEQPDKLNEIASYLFKIKGKKAEYDELQKFSDIIADEFVTAFNIEIPGIITYGRKVYFTCLMVHRGHLPNGYIDFTNFPVLICPEKTEAAIILPSKYWAPEFLFN